MKSLKIFTVWEICLTNHLKAKKTGVTKLTSSLFATLYFLPLSQIWSYELFLPTGTRKYRQLGNTIVSTDGNAINLARKIPISLSQNIHNGIEVHQDVYMSTHNLSNLLPFSSLSQDVFSLVHLFIRHKRPMNIAGNPRFHHLKTVLC